MVALFGGTSMATGTHHERPLGRSSARAVLEQLLESRAPVSRPELAAACQLSRPTVFAAVERLERLGLASAMGRRSGAPGRAAALYAVPSSAGHVVGIDIGGTNLRAAVCDVRGEPLAELRRRTRRRGGAAVIRQAVDLLAEATAATDAGAPLLAAGVSVPGVVDHEAREVLHAWNIGQPKPYDFQSRLDPLIAAPVLLENNVNLAAIGERWHGVARDMRTFAVIAVGTGVGAGIVHEGSLLRGAHGGAGEVGSLPLHRRRRQPAALVEDEAGGVALLREANARGDWRRRPPRDVAELFERAAAGEPPAMALVEDECQRIGEIVATIYAVVDPEAVILTGGVGANDALIRGAATHAAKLSPTPPTVLRSALGERASLVGAIALAAERARGRLLARVDAPSEDNADAASPA